MNKFDGESKTGNEFVDILLDNVTIRDTAMEKYERDARYHLKRTLFTKMKNTCDNEIITTIK